jgi:hypothetical protein
VVLIPPATVLPGGERDAFSTAVAARLAEDGLLVVDYVRLNILAARTGAM